MLISIEGLVTKSINVNDNNKLITILTKDNGIIYAFVNNCKKLNGKLVASSEILTYCQFVLFKNKEKYSVNEAVVLKQFPNIRSNIVKLSLSCYFFELINEIAGKSEFSHEYLRLMLNSLHVMDEDKKDILMVKSVVELKMISIAGYMPDLICCSSCLSNQQETQPNKQHQQGYYFSLVGELICQDCYQNNVNDVKSVMISQGVLFAMRYIIYSDISKIYSFKLSADDVVELAKVAENYLLFKTNLDLPSLRYLKSVMEKE